MARVSIDEGAGQLCIGGGASQPSENCWAKSCQQHSFDRVFCVADNLWKKPGGYTDGWKLEWLEQYFNQDGLAYGPLDIGRPWSGYPLK